MSFLPEEDLEFLAGSGTAYEELTEKIPDGKERRGVLFPSFSFSSNLRMVDKRLAGRDDNLRPPGVGARRVHHD